MSSPDKLRFTKLQDGTDVEMVRSIPDQDHFALEMNHTALCVLNNTQPHTGGGEEGLQDQRIVEAIHRSAANGSSVKVTLPTGPTRGPALPPMMR